MNHIRRCILLILLPVLITGCQAESSSTDHPQQEKPQTKQVKQNIPIMIHAVTKDGSPIAGAGIGFLYLKPNYITDQIGRRTDENGTFPLQFEEGAKVRIQVFFDTGTVTKEIIVSSKLRDIQFVKP